MDFLKMAVFQTSTLKPASHVHINFKYTILSYWVVDHCSTKHATVISHIDSLFLSCLICLEQ